MTEKIDLREVPSEAGVSDELPAAVPRPSREEAKSAVETLLRWAGDNPMREGLRCTPERVVKSYEEYFRGYDIDPDALLKRTFEEVEGYDEIVLLRDIRFESFCEHHMAPIIGHVHIGYLPSNRVVGISKLARVVDAYAKRLQIQEKMTAQIANSIDEALQPRGVAVVIEGEHHCMTTRGIHKPGTNMITSTMLGRLPQRPADPQGIPGPGRPSPYQRALEPFPGIAPVACRQYNCLCCGERSADLRCLAVVRAENVSR